MMMPPNEGRRPSEQQDSFPARFFENQYVNTLTSFPIGDKIASDEDISRMAGQRLFQCNGNKSQARKCVIDGIKHLNQVGHVLNALILGVSAIAIGIFVSKIVVFAGGALTAVAIARGMEIPYSWNTMKQILKHEFSLQDTKKPSKPEDFNKKPENT